MGVQRSVGMNRVYEVKAFADVEVYRLYSYEAGLAQWYIVNWQASKPNC